MEGDIVGGKLGDIGEDHVTFKNGKLRAEISAGSGPVAGGAFIEIDSDKVIDALEKAIPGTFDDVVLELARAALKKL